MARDKTGDDDKTYTPRKNATEDQAFFGAINAANQRKHPVVMMFKAVAVPVKRDSTIIEVKEAYEAAKREKAAQDAADAERAKIKQAQLNEMTGKPLEQAISGGIPALLKWGEEYARLSEVPGVDAKAGSVLPKLIKAGYKAEDEHLTQDTQEHYGRHALGAAIRVLAETGKPPSVFARWSENYAEIGREEIRNKERARASQPRIDALVGKPLDDAIAGGLSAVIKWADEYTRAGVPGVDPKAGSVLPKLIKAGYRVEDSSLQYPPGDLNGYGRQALGNFMQYLARGNPPPDPFPAWAQKYREMEARVQGQAAHAAPVAANPRLFQPVLSAQMRLSQVKPSFTSQTGTEQMPQQEAADILRLQRRQSALDALVGRPLDEAVGKGFNGVIAWAKKYGEAYEEGLNPRKDHVLGRLKLAKYSAVAAQMPGDTPKAATGRRVVAGMMNALEQQGFPPKDLSFWAAEYAKIPDGPRNPTRVR